jgi:flagellin-specific chaperone FliS
MSNKLKEVQDLIKKLSKDELTQQKQLFQKRKEIRENLLALYESFNMWLNQMDLKKMSDTYQHNINLVNNLLKNMNLVDGMRVDLREIVTDVMKKMEELA